MAIIGLLLLVGFLIQYWWVLAAIAAVVMLARGAHTWAAAVDRQRAEHAAIAARADQQHAWYLAGDNRGLYGDGGRIVRDYRKPARTLSNGKPTNIPR